MLLTRRPMPDAVRVRIRQDLVASRDAFARGGDGWPLLEEAHILSQPWAGIHVRVHVRMLAEGVRTRDVREAWGQVLRIVVAGPGSMSGRYPTGNTGRARVPATEPMPMPSDLEALLGGARG